MEKPPTYIFKLTCLCLTLILNPTTSARSLTQNLPPRATTPAPQPATGENSNTQLSFFMYNVLGGIYPSVKPVNGVVVYDNQLPFAKPLGFFPPIHGIPLPDSNPNLPGSNPNDVPFLTGTGGQFPSGITAATLQGLVLGTITVIDVELTESHEMGSTVVGKAQGFYVASSEDGNSQMMAFMAKFEGEGDSLNFFGIHRTASSESHIAVIGGAGKYHNANGYAVIHTIGSRDGRESDGVETKLGFTIYLSE